MSRPLRPPLANGSVVSDLTAEDSRALAADLCAIDPFLSLGYAPDRLAAYLDRPDASLTRFVVRDPDQCCRLGVVAIRSPWLRGPMIELLTILPAAQRRGLGSAVLDWIATQNIAANLWTTVSDFNAPARHFYAKQGFIEIAAIPGLIRPDRAEILLRRSR